MAIRNIIKVLQQEPLALPLQQDPLALPFTDIATQQQLHDLIMSSFEPENASMRYFGLTPVHEILRGC